MDLHLHTPGSADYQEPDVSYVDILRQAEVRGLDIIAFTDHNTVAGYRAMLDEIEQLSLLERLNRIQPDEKRKLAEYRRLLDKILVLPGFEFTATFGFHILGIFAPDTPIRQLEHILLSLNIPPAALDEGSSNVGASADVLTAYRRINEAGGIVIAAHANSSHGVAMRGFDFGGQTKIAYTQDPHLHALEITDLDRKGQRNTARFFDGTKPEYPRRMRCIQGSDAHRLLADPRNSKYLGVGDRITEVLLPERTFDALLDVFESNDFASTRPYRASHAPYDHVQAAREEGPSIVQAFHEGLTRRGGRLFAVIADVCAFANTNGGTIFVGVSAKPKDPPIGIPNVGEAVEMLRDEIEHKITPPLEVAVDVLETHGKSVVRVRVPRGDDPPYAIDDNKIYVRDEAETNLAVRDEIVRLVAQKSRAKESQPPVVESAAVPAVAAEPAPTAEEPARPEAAIEAPRTGVEIIGSEQRKGVMYHMMRDLRNGNVVKNVTRSSARRLWHYAITEHESSPVQPEQVQWHGDIGLWKRYKRGGTVRYDLVQRVNGELRVYYGVTYDGMHGPWQAFAGEDE
ncbi:MAG: putative DNA binding domain-containing protein [Chloroflexota bacterium]